MIISDLSLLTQEIFSDNGFLRCMAPSKNDAMPVIIQHSVPYSINSLFTPQQ